MIKNNNNTYTVTFPNNIKFIVTEEELKDDKVKDLSGNYVRKKGLVWDQGKLQISPYVTYSTGDKNLRLLEIATNKYVHKLVKEDVKSGKIPAESQNNYSLNNYNINDLSIIFRNISVYPTTSVDISKLKASEILMVGSDSNSRLNNLRGLGASHHAFIVKSIDKNMKTITLINPHNTKEEPLVMSFDDFYSRYSTISLKGSYQDTINKTNIIENSTDIDFAKKQWIMLIATHLLIISYLI